MAREFDDGDIERLKKNTSIEAVCRARGIELKRHGARDLIGKCPFHDDKTPSFVVSPHKNLFHCMGCDAAGSVIDLVMKLDGKTFKEVVSELLASTTAVRPAAELATPPPKPPAVSPDLSAKTPKVSAEKANALLERVVAVYEKTFTEALAGRTYLEGRGIGDAGLFSRHRVGYADGRLHTLLPKGGQLKEELISIGVLLQDGTERFKDCIVVPVYDPDGTLVTLYGRKIESSLRTSASPRESRHYFLPDRPTGLWNAAALKTYAHIILVESVIDAMSVMVAGHPNVIAIQGTNGLGEDDIQTLKTHGIQSVTLLLDGDEAGGKAAARLRPRIETAGIAVTVKTLPTNEDPNSYLVAHGAESLAKIIQETTATEPRTPNYFPDGQVETANSIRARGEAPPVPSGTSTALTVTYGLRKYRIMGLEKGPRKLRLTLRVEHGGRLHIDTLDLYSAKSRRILAMDLCRVFEEMPETIEGDLDKLLRHCECLPEADTHPAVGLAKADLPPMSAKEHIEAETFGTSPTLFDDILADCARCGLMGEHNNVLLLYVAMTSRKRDTPLSVLILSSSGAGKTALQDAVLAFCPPEDLVKLTALSGKALFYKDRLSLKNKVLALEEGDGAEEAMYAIRNLISAGELVSESTIKDLATGRLTTMENKVEGPSAVCFTTTRPDVDPETKSRFWVTSIDESRDQTRKILSFQRQQHLSDEPIASPEIEGILRKHRNFQRLLKPVAVKNPYAAQLTYTDDRLQGRRDQPKYLNLIKAVAFLRQMQKETHNGASVPWIEVDRDDVRLANRLAHEILGHSLDEMSRPGRDLLAQLVELKKTRKDNAKTERDALNFFSFSRRDIREFTGWSNYRIHTHLKELLDLEYIVLESGRNGVLCRYRLVYDGEGQDGRKFVLGLVDPDHLAAPTEGGDR